MKKLLKASLLAFCIWIPSAGNATCLYNDFQGWKDCFVKDKLSHKIGAVDIETFQQAQYIPRVIELDKKQPEKKLTYAAYKKLIAIESKSEKAKNFLSHHRELLEKISSEYDVDAEAIVALVALESEFGAIMGKFNIIDSLSTLAYEGRRKEFFEKELINALVISKNEGVSYEKFKGSWAGAMGQCQFMPSSFLAYAVDYDDDGVKDIWGSTEDALASAANYLAKNGWKKGMVGVRKANQEEIAAKGKCDSKGQICTLNSTEKLVFLKENGKLSDTYVVGNNFEVIMRWNRSLYFGLAALTIADNAS